MTGANITYKKKGGGKPTYYIIRRRDNTVGIFSNYIVFAGHIRYALTKGYIPVIDMQNYPNTLLAPELLGKENSWEYYFSQPFNVSLEEAYNGDNVILSNGEVNIPFPYATNELFKTQNRFLIEWQMLVKLGLLRVQPKLYEEIMELRKKLFTPEDRVLGVHLRGTDYVARRPFDHPIQPPIEYALTKVIEKLNEWHCNKIFLATEDKTFVHIFKNVFGDICVTLEKEFVQYDIKKWVSECHSSRENDYFLRGKEYLSDMLMLSICNCFVCGITSGSVGVMMMSDFENVHAFNFGKYGQIGFV